MEKIMKTAIRPSVYLAAFIKKDDMTSHSIQRFSRALIVEIISIVVSVSSIRVLTLSRMANMVRISSSLTIVFGAAFLIFSPVNVSRTVGYYSHILDGIKTPLGFKLPSLLRRHMCFIIVMMFFMYRTAVVNGINGPVTILVSMHPNFVLASIQYQYLSFVRLTSAILTKLIEDLKKSNNILKLNHLLKMYRTTVKATEALNWAFSSANLFITVISIVIMSSYFYFLIRDSIAFLVKKDLSLVLDILVTLLYSSYFFVQLWEVVSVCATAEEKAVLFCNECENIVLEDASMQILHSDKIWIHNMYKPLIRFHAAEYINLDFMLIRQIIGNAITFAILLLQFVQPEVINECYLDYSNSSVIN